MITKVFMPRGCDAVFDGGLDYVFSKPGRDALAETGDAATPFMRASHRVLNRGARSNARNGRLAERRVLPLLPVRVLVDRRTARRSEYQNESEQ